MSVASMVLLYVSVFFLGIALTYALIVLDKVEERLETIERQLE